MPAALAALPQLAELGVAFLEQPVSANNPVAMRDLTRRSPIPIVAHESIFTLRDASEAARTGLGHVWALTPSTHGGLVSTLDIVGTARASLIPCLLGSTVELGIATAFLAHIGGAIDTINSCPIPSDVIGPLYHDADIVENGVRIEAGKALVPSGSGLGVELDARALAKYGAGEWR
jgi:muconate cycloisomerase